MADRCTMSLFGEPPFTTDKSAVKTGENIYLVKGTGSSPLIQKYKRSDLSDNGTILITAAGFLPDTRKGAVAVGKGFLYYFSLASDLAKVDLTTGIATNLGNPFATEGVLTHELHDENADYFLVVSRSGSTIFIKRYDKATGLVIHEASHVNSYYLTVLAGGVLFPMNNLWYIGGGQDDAPALGFSDDLQTLYTNMTDWIIPSSSDFYFARDGQGCFRETGGKVELFASRAFNDEFREVIVDYSSPNVIVDTPIVVTDTATLYGASGYWGDPSNGGVRFDGTNLFLLSQTGYAAPAQCHVLKLDPDTRAVVNNSPVPSGAYGGYSNIALDWE